MLNAVNAAAYPVAAARTLPAETSRVHCLLRVTHSWLAVVQHFLARVPRDTQLKHCAKTETEKQCNGLEDSLVFFFHSFTLMPREQMVKYYFGNNTDSQIFFKSHTKFHWLKLKINCSDTFVLLPLGVLKSPQRASWSPLA